MLAIRVLATANTEVFCTSQVRAPGDAWQRALKGDDSARLCSQWSGQRCSIIENNRR